ncbi:hypothetical protein [Streptacidiphilus sp. EB103A]|uniref:hypothetical protein n=1 Tax=Streptacidiphilus sp. EB103A TaxID=3156275 RepID=UPI0035114BA1
MGEENAPALRGPIARVIAIQLAKLMADGHPDGTGPKDYHAVARASADYAKQHGGPTISHQAVHNLRREQNGNPGINGLEALANVYNVQVKYFLEEGSPPDPAVDPANTELPPDTAAPNPEAVLGRLHYLLVDILPKPDIADTDPGAGDSAATGQSLETDEGLAAAAGAMGTRIGAADIAALRAGQWNEPLREPLRALAEKVGVPADYFLDDAVAAETDRDLATLTNLRRMGARTVAMRRVAELTDDSFDALRPILEHLSRDSKRHRM